MRSSNKVKLIIVLALIALGIAVIAGWFFFLRQQADRQRELSAGPARSAVVAGALVSPDKRWALTIEGIEQRDEPEEYRSLNEPGNRQATTRLTVRPALRRLPSPLNA
jgi:hypothetical protein